MDLSFGKRVAETARRLVEEGKDANQVAKIVYDQDPKGYNYGIGIMLDNRGKPMATSPTLMEYSLAELEASAAGNYMSSGAIMGELKSAVLSWQQIPEKYWDNFTLTLPSDAGTGAVRMAVDTLVMSDPSISSIGLESLGWPAYKSIAEVARLKWKEHDGDAIMRLVL